MSTLLLTACPDSNKTNAQQKPAAPATVKPAPAKPAPDDASAKTADKDAVIITSIIKAKLTIKSFARMPQSARRTDVPS